QLQSIGLRRAAKPRCLARLCVAEHPKHSGNAWQCQPTKQDSQAARRESRFPMEHDMNRSREPVPLAMLPDEHGTSENQAVLCGSLDHTHCPAAAN
ncbi:MAG TPA: hypothetical protein PLY87_21400, partial [Planctomycetaceae bacterium]|nr:hypothetical protein [Planctomycetaceae bacterium]